MPSPGNTQPADSTGVVQEITGAAQKVGYLRFDEKLAYAQRAGDHFWVALVYYRLDDPSEQPFHLDSENIGGPPMLLCYRCEELYNPRLLKRRCPGEPKDG